MNILMMSNTYKPLVGGLEKSIESFTKRFREEGHRVIVVAPEFVNMKEEKDVIRIPAIQNAGGSQFSIQLPIPGVLTEALGDFKPNIVHAHHPFLVGDTALRIARKHHAPLVYTHHTLFEQNTHYLPGNPKGLKRFVIELSTGYANLADLVFAPSESVMDLIKERGVTTPVKVVPTGVNIQRFSKGARTKFRNTLKIPLDSFVVGHVGRLAPEKNLEFMASAVATFLKLEPNARFLVGGNGPSEEGIKAACERQNVGDRLYMAGVLKGKDLVSAYHAMDVFAFASQSETQGLVITEAMCAGLPVVAVDAPGVREVVVDNLNGRLLSSESLEDFVSALSWVARSSSSKIKKMKEACRHTAKQFSIKISSESALDAYKCLLLKDFARAETGDDSAWAKALSLFQAQWDLTKNVTQAAGAYLQSEEKTSKGEENKKEDLVGPTA